MELLSYDLELIYMLRVMFDKPLIIFFLFLDLVYKLEFLP